MHTKRAEYSGINFGNISFCRTLYKVDKVPVAEYHSVSEVPGDIKCHVTATESLDNWHYYYHYYHHYHYQHV